MSSFVDAIEPEFKHTIEINNPIVRDSYSILTEEGGPADAYYRTVLNGEGIDEQLYPFSVLKPDFGVLYYPKGNLRTKNKEIVSVVDHAHDSHVSGVVTRKYVKKFSLGLLGLEKLKEQSFLAAPGGYLHNLNNADTVANYATDMNLPLVEVGIFNVLDEQNQSTDRKVAYLFYLMHRHPEVTFDNLKNALG